LSWDADVLRASQSMARRIRCCPADHQDLAQEARLRLLTAYRSRGNMPKEYGRRIVRNALVSAARPVIREQRQHANDVDVEDVVEDDGVGHPGGGTGKLIAKLPRRMRHVYTLLYVKDLSQREAAAKLRVTQPRVAQLHRELLERARALVIAA
jgi:DNA-directed RNA polymerase specialized sigma24 family protein